MRIRRLLSAACLVAAAFLPAACGKPREVPYAKLTFEDNVFQDPATGRPFTGLAKDFYKDGTLKAEFPMRNGRFHGTVREWHPNGKPMAETEFRDGERTGLNREWNASGQPYIERVYDRDRIVSERKF